MTKAYNIRHSSCLSERAVHPEARSPLGGYKNVSAWTYQSPSQCWLVEQKEARGQHWLRGSKHRDRERQDKFRGSILAHFAGLDDERGVMGATDSDQAPCARGVANHLSDACRAILFSMYSVFCTLSMRDSWERTERPESLVY